MRSDVEPALIGVGGSTGGPTAALELLAALPAGLPICVLLIQHLPPTFVAPFARHLRAQVGYTVEIVDRPRRLRAGAILLPPGDRHVGLDGEHAVPVDADAAAVVGRRWLPSIDHTLTAIAGRSGLRVGVLLSGIGEDGAEGLAAMRRSGARTFAQDRASARVWDIPEAAWDRGAVERLLAPQAIAAAIVDACD